MTTKRWTKGSRRFDEQSPDSLWVSSADCSKLERENKRLRTEIAQYEKCLEACSVEGLKIRATLLEIRAAIGKPKRTKVTTNG